jgi:MoaD family protein
MTIKVSVPTVLRSYTGGNATVEGGGVTLTELFDDLGERYQGLKQRVIAENGQPLKFVNIYVNDEDIRFSGSMQTALSDGDTVTIIPAVAGGSR